MATSSEIIQNTANVSKLFPDSIIPIGRFASLSKPSSPRLSREKTRKSRHNKHRPQQDEKYKPLKMTKSSPTPHESISSTSFDAQYVKAPKESTGFFHDDEKSEGDSLYSPHRTVSDHSILGRSKTAIASQESVQVIKPSKKGMKEEFENIYPSDFDTSFLNSVMGAESVTDTGDIPDLSFDCDDTTANTTSNMPFESTDHTTTSLVSPSVSAYVDIQDGLCPFISPWQRWFITKEAEARKKDLVANKKAAVKEQVELKQQREKERKDAKSKAEIDAWMQRKKEDDIKAKEAEKRRKLQEIAVKETLELQKQQLREKAMRKWQSVKSKELEEKRREQEQLQEMKKQQLQRKQEENFKAFLKWYKKSAPSIKSLKDSSSFVSVGYNGQKLQAFYDRTTAPNPTFINPNTWTDPNTVTEEEENCNEPDDGGEAVYNLWVRACSAEAAPVKGTRSRSKGTNLTTNVPVKGGISCKKQNPNDAIPNYRKLYNPSNRKISPLTRSNIT